MLSPSSLNSLAMAESPLQKKIFDLRKEGREKFDFFFEHIYKELETQNRSKKSQGKCKKR